MVVNGAHAVCNSNRKCYEVMVTCNTLRWEGMYEVKTCDGYIVCKDEIQNIVTFVCWCVNKLRIKNKLTKVTN